MPCCSGSSSNAARKHCRSRRADGCTAPAAPRRAVPDTDAARNHGAPPHRPSRRGRAAGAFGSRRPPRPSACRRRQAVRTVDVLQLRSVTDRLAERAGSWVPSRGLTDVAPACERGATWAVDARLHPTRRHRVGVIRAPRRADFRVTGHPASLVTTRSCRSGHRGPDRIRALPTQPVSEPSAACRLPDDCALSPPRHRDR